jgi:hypothetical protein
MKQVVFSLFTFLKFEASTEVKVHIVRYAGVHTSTLKREAVFASVTLYLLVRLLGVLNHKDFSLCVCVRN